MNIESYQKDFLISEIKKIAKRNTTNRLRGWINNFHKIIYYKSLMLFNRTTEIKAKTFWNGYMDIVLPESVSINIWRNGFAESDVSFYLIKYLNAGETFVDIGAHFGFYSLLASSIVGKEGQVISFEPTISTFSQLSKNISYSRDKNISIYNLAAFDSKQILEFNDFGIINSAFNSFFTSRGGNKYKGDKIKVNTIVLDDFLNENYFNRKISMIKIDAESSEYKILSGLKNTLIAHQPLLILEVGDYSISGVKSSRELIQIIQGYGYKSYELDKDNYQIQPYQIKNNESYKNILFLPY